MDNKKYNEIIDEVYERYHTETFLNSDNKWLNELDGMNLGNGELTKVYRQFTQEEFINEIKTDDEFAEKWGLKIEERELSINERGELFRETYPEKSVDDFSPGGMEVQSLKHQLDSRYNKANIPTKLITITYNNNKTIEVYE